MNPRKLEQAPKRDSVRHLFDCIHADQITATAGSSVPFTKTTDRLDTGFEDVAEWLKGKLGIADLSSIHITAVVDGIPCRGVLTAQQLLGNNVGSILQTSGAVDVEDSHAIVLLVRCCPMESGCKQYAHSKRNIFAPRFDLVRS